MDQNWRDFVSVIQKDGDGDVSRITFEEFQTAMHAGVRDKTGDKSLQVKENKPAYGSHLTVNWEHTFK